MNARIQSLESSASAAELVAAVRDDFLAYDRKPANTSRHHWIWPVPPLAEVMPINWLLEPLLYLGTRLTSLGGPKVSNRHPCATDQRLLSGISNAETGLTIDVVGPQLLSLQLKESIMDSDTASPVNVPWNKGENCWSEGSTET